MMRSFLTRLANSLTRTLLLVPCLLICLACATPFPIENLEEGMTAESVRVNFGAPEDIETETGEVELAWTYVDEKQMWPMFVFPQVLLSIPILAAWPGVPWDYAYVTRRPVTLHFGAEKLVGWDVGEFSWIWTPGPVSSSFMNSMNQGIDWQHHQQGHTHHHDDGC